MLGKKSKSLFVGLLVVALSATSLLVLGAPTPDEKLKVIEEIEKAPKEDYLTILGLTPEEFKKSSDADLKKQLRRRRRFIHFDFGRLQNDAQLPDRADGAFKKLTEAYTRAQLALVGKVFEQPAVENTEVNRDFPFQPGYVPRRLYYEFVAKSSEAQRAEMEKEFQNAKEKEVNPWGAKPYFTLTNYLEDLLGSGPINLANPQIGNIIEMAFAIYEANLGHKLDRDLIYAEIIDFDRYRTFATGNHFGTRTQSLATLLLLPEVIRVGGRESYKALLKWDAELSANQMPHVIKVFRAGFLRQIRLARSKMRERDSSVSKIGDGAVYMVKFCRQILTEIRGY